MDDPESMLGKAIASWKQGQADPFSSRAQGRRHAREYVAVGRLAKHDLVSVHPYAQFTAAFLL